MFEILTAIFKYLLVFVVYAFIFWIIKLISLDIKYISRKTMQHRKKTPYLKLLNLIENINFKLSESYVISDRTYIGRTTNNDIVLEAPFFSGRHACIFKQNNMFYIQDLGSKNGTFVNGQMVPGNPVPIKNGDIIQIGQIISFIFINES